MFRVELFRNNLITEQEKKFGVNSEKSRSKDGEELWQIIKVNNRIVYLEIPTVIIWRIA